ncbi:rac GTPase-activating protein 1 isoform X2 [Cryptotermes secundus]|nr:rac GTPase-activating protein 1 isoform X2 [Cryptotermes secundus]
MSLSLLASYDDLIRCSTVLAQSSCEPEFIRFALNQEGCRQKWLAAVLEAQRLQAELEKANQNNTVLEAKLKHARLMLDKEKKKRLLAEGSSAAMEKKLNLVRDLVFVEGCGKINDETKEKLGFLNVTTNSFAGYDEVAGGHDTAPRLHTISEAMDSTGSLLSDLSYSRSEDDLDSTLTRCGKVWKKHRPSLTAGDDPPSAKRRRSAVEKTIQFDGMGMNAETVVATTTLTVGKEGGPIKASAKLEAVPSSEPRNIGSSKQEEVKNWRNVGVPYVSLVPSAPRQCTDEHGWGSNQMTPLTSRNTNMSSNVRGGHSLGLSNKLKVRTHDFCTKTIIYPENCGPCGKRMKFGKLAMKCRDCRTSCHPECKEQVPLPCVPVGNTPTRGGGAMGTIADYTPHTAPMIPSIIVHCVNEVERRGLNEAGIYRLSGADKDVKGLKEKFLRAKGVPNLSKIDINVVSGAIKDFLRSLHEPLLSYTLWHDFVKAAENSDPDDARAAMFQAISELPQPNRDTLAFLIMHLQRVAASPDCRMPASNIAKVFGPTIVGYSRTNPSPVDILHETKRQPAVIEHLLSIPSDYWANFVNVGTAVSIYPQIEHYLTPSPERLNPPVGSASRSGFTPASSTFRKRSKKFFAAPPITK